MRLQLRQREAYADQLENQKGIIHFKNFNYMKKLTQLAIAIGFTGMCLSACSSYSTQDYVNDMKNLTEETLQNASTYTEEDWKRVGEEYRKINQKGKKVLEKMTEDQKKELEKFAEEMGDKAAEFNHDELKKQFNDLMEQADDFINNIKEQIQNLEEENL